MDLKFLRTHTPKNVTMLSDRNCVWRADLPRRVPDELPGLDLLYGAFWSISFEQDPWPQGSNLKTLNCSAPTVCLRGFRAFSHGGDVYLLLGEYGQP